MNEKNKYVTQFKSSQEGLSFVLAVYVFSALVLFSCNENKTQVKQDEPNQKTNQTQCNKHIDSDTTYIIYPESNGTKTGEFKVCDNNKNLIELGYLHKDSVIGRTKFFDAEGNKIKEKSYRRNPLNEDKLINNEIMFFDSLGRLIIGKGVYIKTPFDDFISEDNLKELRFEFKQGFNGFDEINVHTFKNKTLMLDTTVSGNLENCVLPVFDGNENDLLEYRFTGIRYLENDGIQRQVLIKSFIYSDKVELNCSCKDY